QALDPEARGGEALGHDLLTTFVGGGDRAGCDQDLSQFNGLRHYFRGLDEPAALAAPVERCAFIRPAIAAGKLGGPVMGRRIPAPAPRSHIPCTRNGPTPTGRRLASDSTISRSVPAAASSRSRRRPSRSAPRTCP